MIIHVDMDAFYASVEQRDNPELRGLPIAVGGSADGRGVVATASYEARVFGVRSAMAMRTAVRMCPTLRIVRPRIDYYAQISRQIRAIFEEFTPIIEPLSLDEAFLDVRNTAHLFGGPIAVGNQIKTKIAQQLHLPASVGIAPNKFVAKIASDLKKPNAFVTVLPEDVEAFLEPLPIERIWGVGTVTSSHLNKLSLRTIGDLKRLSREDLRSIAGNNAERFWALSRGMDQREVVPYRDAKSVSSETTFSEDIIDRELLEANLRWLVETVARRLRSHNWKGKGVELKVKYHDFQSISRSQMLDQPTDLTQDLWEAGKHLLRKKIPDDHRPIRLIGFGVHHLAHQTYEQLSLFDQPTREKNRELDKVTDTIAAKFGKHAILRANTNQLKPNSLKSASMRPPDSPETSLE